MNGVVLALLVSLLIVAICISLHFVCLRAMGRTLMHHPLDSRWPLLKVLFALFALHFIQVLIYAVAMVLMDSAGYGTLSGAGTATDGKLFDYFYFSMASYTTLGIGDILPHGPVRLVAAIEALNGLILIAWSASFAYLMMEHFWVDHPKSGPDA